MCRKLLGILSLEIYLLSLVGRIFLYIIVCIRILYIVFFFFIDIGVLVI